jgi:hypothetical protein
VILNYYMKKTKKDPVEKWKDVKDPFFGNYYQISNLGRLKSKARKIYRGGDKNRYVYNKPEFILKLRRSKEQPHLFTTMFKKDNGLVSVKSIYVHKAVAEAFIKRPSAKHIYVEHIDGDYKNNNVSNLKWLTASESSKKSMEKYPENKNKIKETNIKNGYYEKIKSPNWKKRKTILELYKKGISGTYLSRWFKCSSATIYNIIRNKK